MSNLHFDLSLKYCNNVIPSILFVSTEAVEAKKDAESSPVEVRTDERAKKEDNTKSPAKPAAATEQTEQKETTPKGEKEQDEKVIDVQAMV